MTDRERLVKLLKGSTPIIARYWDDGEIEEIADCLIENGVVVLPCKVENIVYYVNGKYYEDIIKCTVKEICQDEKEMTIKTQSWDRCVPGLLERYDRWFKVEDFGKTVFLSREEAERAVKGGAE